MRAVPRKHKLIELAWPEFGTGERPRSASLEEFRSRVGAARHAMDLRRLTHLVIYGDREHFANLAYLTGFDPRFEEALLVIPPRELPVLIVGNECEAYLSVSPLVAAHELRSERFQSFSLLNQPRDSSRLLDTIFRDLGMGKGSSIGCVGWKYFTSAEHPLGPRAIDLPAYVVDTLRDLAAPENVVNATDIFMDPDRGLRTFCSPAEIAYFEYTSMLASEGMRRILFGLRDGMTDYEAVQLAAYNGEPLGCHVTFATGENRHGGLASPAGARIRRGDFISLNVSYWGSNSCRAGWAASASVDLPPPAQGYVEEFAGVYFEAMNQWFGLLRVGQTGEALNEIIRTRLPFEKFGIFLNPGHLIHLDEWVSSPIFAGSKIPIHSGMAMQVDVIPSSSTYFSTRMEDGVVIADRDLRESLHKQYPDCLARGLSRREFMRNTLGIDVGDDVLPLSNMPAIVPPYFFKPNHILVMGN
jgi:Xaa-Pro aminopeptidase